MEPGSKDRASVKGRAARTTPHACPDTWLHLTTVEHLPTSSQGVRGTRPQGLEEERYRLGFEPGSGIHSSAAWTKPATAGLYKEMTTAALKGSSGASKGNVGHLSAHPQCPGDGRPYEGPLQRLPLATMLTATAWGVEEAETRQNTAYLKRPAPERQGSFIF